MGNTGGTGAPFLTWKEPVVALAVLPVWGLPVPTDTWRSKRELHPWITRAASIQVRF